MSGCVLFVYDKIVLQSSGFVHVMSTSGEVASLRAHITVRFRVWNAVALFCCRVQCPLSLSLLGYHCQHTIGDTLHIKRARPTFAGKSRFYFQVSIHRFVNQRSYHLSA